MFYVGERNETKMVDMYQGNSLLPLLYKLYKMCLVSLLHVHSNTWHDWKREVIFPTRHGCDLENKYVEVNCLNLYLRIITI